MPPRASHMNRNLIVAPCCSAGWLYRLRGTIIELWPYCSRGGWSREGAAIVEAGGSG